jgi:hypothetical protein
VLGGAVVSLPEVGTWSAGSGTYRPAGGSVVSVAELGGSCWPEDPVAWAAATAFLAGGPIPPPRSAARAGPAARAWCPPTIEVARVTATAWSATRRARGRVAHPTARTADGSLVRLASRYSTVDASSQ